LDKDGNIIIHYKVLGTGYRPAIIADQNQNIHMVYSDPTGTGISIKYLKLNQNGDVLVAPKTISIHQHNNSPHMAMDSLQYLHVVWHLEDPMGIVYSKLDTLGNYVISPMLVVYPPEAIWPGHPRIAVDRGNRLHLVWQDQRQDSAVTSDIYYKRGENESAVEEYSSPNEQAHPQLSISPNPFYEATIVQYSFADACKDQGIGVYDILGRKVKELEVSDVKGFVVWDGTDNLGIPLPAGVYYIKLSGIDNEISVKVILLR
jgi:hypothetical protein